MSLFPERTKWSPPGHAISALEKTYLQGPQVSVKFYKRLEVCHGHTGRLIVYTTAESEKSQRISSSYVVVQNDQIAQQTPRFGRIVSLFQHSLAEQTFNWAVLDEYETPFYDPDSKLWRVAMNIAMTSTIPLKNLSLPLVVAKDPVTAELWFLNYN